MKKIYLSGYYGWDNLGDDYIFYSILDQLSDLHEMVEVNVQIGNALFDTASYEEMACGYDNVKLKFTFINGIKGRMKKLLSIARSNFWIIGGGGLFTSQNVKGQKHFNTYLRFAKLVRTKACIYGIDIDSLRDEDYLQEWRKTIANVDFIETRNSKCAQQLVAIRGG